MTPDEALKKLLEPIDLAGDLASLERHLHERDALIRLCDLKHMDPETSAALARRQEEIAGWIESLSRSLSAQWEGAKRFRHLAKAEGKEASGPPKHTSRRG